MFDTEDIETVNDLMRAVADKNTDICLYGDKAIFIYDGFLIIETNRGQFWFEIDGRVMQVL
jgi:hypothetical protein